ncbi:MAG: prepilin peptidase [Lachnospiraceae bacterium]
MVLLLKSLLIVLTWLIGASVFSFVNVLVYRVPRDLPFVRGHSFCPECGHHLAVLDLIPVFNRLLLKGRCRYCGTRIPARDTWIELSGGCIALLCVYKTANMAAAVTGFVFLTILMAVALVDMDTMEITDGFVLALLFIGLISLAAVPGLPLTERLIGIVSVSFPLLLITLVIPGAFGGGDIKLMAACGLFLGWRLSLLSLFLAIMTGGMYGIYLLAAGKKGRKDHFAFGPFLCVGMLAALFWGEAIIGWYLKICGF